MTRELKELADRIAALQHATGKKIWLSLYEPERDAIVTALRAASEGGAYLKDPIAVHLGMLRGEIAKPSWDQIQHIYKAEFAALSRPSTERMGTNPALESRPVIIGSQSELLPCPFCGSASITLSYFGQPATKLAASCQSCMAHGPIMERYADPFVPWNMRAVDHQSDASSPETDMVPISPTPPAADAVRAQSFNDDVAAAQTVRAQTIEECAKVAENSSGHQTGRSIARAIRALSATGEG